MEKKVEELGYHLCFAEIRPNHWYPEALLSVSALAAKELFGWPDLFEFGYNSPVFSFGIKIFIKYVPLAMFLRQFPSVWRKFVDVGEIEVPEFSERKKYVLVRLKDFKYHPAMCRYLAGFFLRMSEYFIESKKITIEETKCMFKEDSYHEYLVRWL